MAKILDFMAYKKKIENKFIGGKRWEEEFQTFKDYSYEKECPPESFRMNNLGNEEKCKYLIDNGLYQEDYMEFVCSQRYHNDLDTCDLVEPYTDWINRLVNEGSL